MGSSVGTALIAAGAVLLAAGAEPAGAEWLLGPALRASAGDESDVVIDPAVTQTIVPGGPFIELTPSISARRWVGGASILDLGTFATLQQFLNDASRRLYAQSVWGDFYTTWSPSLRARFSTSFDFYDDSQRDTVRRLGLGGEVGVGYVANHWSTEFWGGGRGRRYPGIGITDARGDQSTYVEGTWIGGATLRARLTPGLDLRTDGFLQRTAARDPDYDADSWTVSAVLDLRPGRRLLLTMSGSWQERRFVNRQVGIDRDDYGQLGIGMRYPFRPGWSAAVRAAFATYSWPDGTGENTHRLALSIERGWGRADAPPRTRVDIEPPPAATSGTLRQSDPEGVVRLRVRATAAAAVSVAGDFNSWTPGATPLHPVGDGWWEVRLELAPGVYEYAYVIDGVWTTPPEATVTVDDGFGDRNGLLEVVPPGD